jgi:hypothetical protein
MKIPLPYNLQPTTYNLTPIFSLDMREELQLRLLVEV